jgi:hypothetical protein
VTDIEVRSCTVRVVRRDGWSWGASPRRLLDEVLAAVPVLIADALAAAVPDGAEGEVPEPVQVTVPVRRADLLALARARPAASWPDPAAPELQTVLAAALRRALTGNGKMAPAPEAVASQLGIAAAVPAEPDTPGPALLRLLLNWHYDGHLGDLLERLPEPVMDAWHEAMVAGWRAASSTPADAQQIRSALDASAGAGRPAEPDPYGWLQLRLVAMTAIAGQTGTMPGHPEVLAALDARFGPRPAVSGRPVQDVDAEAKPPGHAHPASGGVIAGGPAGSSGRVVPDRPMPGPSRATVVRVGSALPFLVLAQLSRIGWVDVLAAAAGAAGLTAHWPQLAAALAFTVLDEPEDGRRRSPKDLATAAVFARAATPFVERPLPDAAQLLAAPLDAVLGRCLADGHRAGDPLLLMRASADDGLVLLDAAGLFPMAWADDAAGLAGWLRICPGSRLVAGPGAGPIPEPWDETAAASEPDDLELLQRAELVVTRLHARRARLSARPPTLERSLILAAGAALASIAWSLWGSDEPTDPLLALERLGSLDAVVHDDTEVVRVVLPLGGRYFALHDHGLLGEIPALPWLGGQAVEIVGG